jgi:hypothetical protein
MGGTYRGTVKVERLVFSSIVSKRAGRLQVNIPKAVNDTALFMLGKKVRVTLEVIEKK